MMLTISRRMESLMRSVSVSPYLSELPSHLFDQVIKRISLINFLVQPQILLALRQDDAYWRDMATQMAEKTLGLTPDEWSCQKGSDAFQEYFYLRLVHLTMVLRDVERIKRECNVLVLTSGCIVKELKLRRLCLPLLACGLIDHNNVDKVRTMWELMSRLHRRQQSLRVAMQRGALPSRLFNADELKAALVNPISLAVRVYAVANKIPGVAGLVDGEEDELAKLMDENKKDLKTVLHSDKSVKHTHTTTTDMTAMNVVDLMKRRLLLLRLLEAIHVCDAALCDFRYFKLEDPNGTLSTKNKSRVKICDPLHNYIYSDVSIYLMRILKETGTPIDWAVSEVLPVGSGGGGGDTVRNAAERIKRVLTLTNKVKDVKSPLTVNDISEKRRFDTEYETLFDVARVGYLEISLDFTVKHNIPIYLKEVDMVGREQLDRNNIFKYLKEKETRLAAEITLISSLFDYHSKSLDVNKGQQLKSCLTFREFVTIITQYLSDEVKSGLSLADLTAVIKEFAQPQGLQITESATIKLNADGGTRTIVFTNAYINNPLYGYHYCEK